MGIFDYVVEMLSFGEVEAEAQKEEKVGQAPVHCSCGSGGDADESA